MTVQARIDWLKQRQSGIGGSEIAAIVGLNQFKTPMQIWESKVNPITEDNSTNEPMYKHLTTCIKPCSPTTTFD